MKRSIVLTGFMGTGKTQVGKILSKKLKLNFFDTDGLIEEKIGLQISDIFKKFGENSFRQMEADIVKEISKTDTAVISCGGGTVLNKENIAILQEKGIVVNLYASTKVIYERIKNNSDRPMLKCQNSLIKIEELLQIRKEAYANCDFSFNTDEFSILEVVSGLINKLNRFGFVI
ncbi:MAG: shikimate kinase [Endomicrobium sp.]|jgi:shikimate kinase|nr:shikimate kinase [Endomicrobium sp.]